MTATIHQLAPNAANAPGGSLKGTDACASQPAGPGSARPSFEFLKAVRVMLCHARLTVGAAAKGDLALEKRLLLQQGQVLIQAGQQLVRESAP